MFYFSQNVENIPEGTLDSVTSANTM